MKLLIITLATIFTFASFCESCSPAEGHEWKSIAELTKLAPLVLHAKVVARAKRWEYNATLNVTHVYKGKLNETQIVVAGFADEASCRSEVFVGDEKIFFLDVKPFRARYDDLYSAVATNSSETFQGILEGLCCPYTPGRETRPQENQLSACSRSPIFYDDMMYIIIYSHHHML
jgi:hypothetical protein